MGQERGFTIIELLITMAVLVIAISIGVPNLSNFIAKQRVSGQATELLNSLAFARLEATKRNANVVVIPATNSQSGWSNGWCVGTTAIDNCNHAEVIRNYQSTAGGVQISSPYLQSTNRLTFRRDGTLLLGISAQKFKVTAPNLEPTGNAARCVAVSAMGKATSTKVNRDDDC